MSTVTAQAKSVVRFVVAFKDVGRTKKNWSESLKQQPTEAILQRLVRKSGALMSRDIVCEFTDDANGTVYAGIRPVGTFTVKGLDVSGSDPFSADHVALAMADLV